MNEVHYCVAVGCLSTRVARGMCKKHWRRWRKGKDINAPSVRDKTAHERFMEKVDASPGGCWIWQAGTKGRGGMKYGCFQHGGKVIGAHRASWLLHRGPLAPVAGEKEHVCHRCDNPLCVNPDHLFIGSRTDNARDKISKSRCGQKNKTHCPQGHEYTTKNTYTTKKGSRMCRTCCRIKQQKRMAQIRMVQCS